MSAKKIFKRCKIPFEGRTDWEHSDFEFKRQLGQGQFGTVYLAESKNSGSRYAVKVISKKQIIEEQFLEVSRELRILMGTDHPYILTFHTYFEDPKSLYIVTEFAEKGNLLQLLKRKNIKSKDTIKLFVQILKGVEYLHS